MPPIDALRERLAELADLSSLGLLAAWDQRAMMPPGGAPARSHAFATLERLMHQRATGDELGAWIAKLEADGDGLSDLDRDLVRLARRDWDRRRRVPRELAGQLAQAGAEGQATWQVARAENDFGAFAPALRRNVELAREYAACFPDAAGPYDALLADYDFGLTAARVKTVFDRLAEELPPMVAEAAARPALPKLHVPVEAQQAAVRATLARLGVDAESWRVDTSAHPFSATISPGDSRMTTRYEDAGIERVLAAVHEFGHGLYERQIAARLARTNLGCGTSMSIHESQSKLWENHVGQHPAFLPSVAAALTDGGYPVDTETLLSWCRDLRPSLIRTSADQLTYPLHIVLRFGLELELVEGRLDVADVPEAWNEGMRRLLGIDVPDDAHGVLQDVHWAAGSFGYFPSYALGCLISAQLWETLEADLGPQAEAIARGDFAPIREWLGDRIHQHGRRLDTEPLLERATGRGLDAEPFLRHVRMLMDDAQPDSNIAVSRG